MNLNAGATLNTPGELRLSGGTLNLVSGGAPTAQTFTMSGGTLTGRDAFTVSGATTWTAGTMSGSGSTVAAAGLTLSGSGNKDLDERTLVNQAAAVWTGGNFRNGNGSVFDNSGSFDIQTDADILLNLFPYNATLVNSGSITRSAGGAATAIGPYVENSGSITVQTGTLQLSGGGHATGSFAPSAPAILEFGGGTHDLDTGSSVGGTGIVLVTNPATVNLGAGALMNSPAELQITGGTLNLVSGGAPTAQTLSMSGGTLTGPTP